MNPNACQLDDKTTIERFSRTLAGEVGRQITDCLNDKEAMEDHEESLVTSVAAFADGLRRHGVRVLVAFKFEQAFDNDGVAIPPVWPVRCWTDTDTEDSPLGISGEKPEHFTVEICFHPENIDESLTPERYRPVSWSADPDGVLPGGRTHNHPGGTTQWAAWHDTNGRMHSKNITHEKRGNDERK